METAVDTSLQASSRDNFGKGWARKVRQEGQLPAVMYGPLTEPQPLTLDPNQLLTIFKETQDRNTVVRVQVDNGGDVPCLVREVQRHPLSRELLHVDLYAVNPEGEVEVMVPLTTVGRPKGAVLGGRIRLNPP